jgi:2-oxo-4-hydroxy-4-carboxy-5-ureidoimidazoline decarboxylase
MTDGARRLSHLPEAEAAAALRACCASSRWVARMLSQRPFKGLDDVYESAERIWWDLAPEDWLEAMAAEAERPVRPTATDEELREAAAGQARTTRLRLEDLLTL